MHYIESVKKNIVNTNLKHVLHPSKQTNQGNCTRTALNMGLSRVLVCIGNVSMNTTLDFSVQIVFNLSFKINTSSCPNHNKISKQNWKMANYVKQVKPVNFHQEVLVLRNDKESTSRLANYTCNVFNKNGNNLPHVLKVNIFENKISYNGINKIFPWLKIHFYNTTLALR